MTFRLVVPSRYLATVFFGAGLLTVVPSAYIVRTYRYAEWSTLIRAQTEALAFVLPGVAILCGIFGFSSLRDGLPWLSPIYIRAPRALALGSLILGVASSLGWLVGSLPIFWFGVATSTYGSPRLVSVVGAALWVAAVAVTSSAVCVALDSAWASAPLALALVTLFYHGRLINTPFEVPTTRAPFLPFDGRAWDVGGTQIENPSTSWIRLIFAVLMIVVAMWRLTKVLGETRRIHRLGTLLRGPGWAAIALAAVAIGLRPVGLQSAVEPVLICRGTAPKVCLLSAHERDLDAAVAVAARARAAAGRQLFNATLVSEGAPARSRAAIRIAIVSDRGVDVSRSFAEQISAWLVDFDACLSRRPQNPEMTSAAATIVRWYAAQSDDRAERTSDSDTVVADWGTRPDEVNGVLRTKADRVSRCQMRLTDLP